MSDDAPIDPDELPDRDDDDTYDDDEYEWVEEDDGCP